MIRQSGGAPGGDTESSGRGDEVLDAASSLHPWGAPPGVRGALLRALSAAEQYPPTIEPLREALRGRLGVRVTVGGGATELLVAHFRGCRRVVLEPPCPRAYVDAADAARVPVVYREVLQQGDCAVIGRPNSPDGRTPSVSEIAKLAVRYPSVRVVVDESLLGFTSEASAVGLTAVASNVAVVASMSKTFAIAGLRLGWTTGLPRGAVTPAAVNAFAIAAGLACVEAWDWPLRPPLDAWRRVLTEDLRALPGVLDVRGAANVLLVRLAGPWSTSLHARLRREGILIRDASDLPGLDAHYLRIAVRAAPENARVVSALGAALLDLC